MTSRARALLSENNGDGNPGMFARFQGWVLKVSNLVATSGMKWGNWVYSNSRHIGWFIVTTGMVTALPLIFEIKREMEIEELEKLQVNAAIAEGKTPQELANSGLTSAVDPKVLK